MNERKCKRGTCPRCDRAAARDTGPAASDWNDVIGQGELDLAIANELRRPRAIEHGLTGEQLWADLARQGISGLTPQQRGASLGRLINAGLVATTLRDRFTPTGRQTVAVYWWEAPASRLPS